jgi:hypothetical protein
MIYKRSFIKIGSANHTSQERVNFIRLLVLFQTKEIRLKIVYKNSNSNIKKTGKFHPPKSLRTIDKTEAVYNFKTTGM